MSKKEMKILKLPYQIEVDDIIGRSGFVQGTQGVTAIQLEGGVVTVKRDGKPDLVFAGNFYGTAK
jgi:hypothetical protein